MARYERSFVKERFQRGNTRPVYMPKQGASREEQEGRHYECMWHASIVPPVHTHGNRLSFGFTQSEMQPFTQEHILCLVVPSFDSPQRGSPPLAAERVMDLWIGALAAGIAPCLVTLTLSENAGGESPLHFYTALPNALAVAALLFPSMCSNRAHGQGLCMLG